MEKAFLESCLAEGLSLEAIGKRAARHPSTIGYWLKKHGLEASYARRNAPKGRLEKSELEALIQSGLSLRQIADCLERGFSTVRYWIDRYELELPEPSDTSVGELPKKVTRTCRRHGEAIFTLEGRGYYRCTRCRAAAVVRRRQVIKAKLVREAGGQCSICGYSRCQRALQFHHLDPATKEFHLGHNGITRSLAKSRAEASKCVLLCANCHAEVEAGFVALPVNSAEAKVRVAIPD